MKQISLRPSVVRLLVLSCLLTLPLPFAKADDKPQPDPRLQQLLKRYPDADKNKDGVLTRAEAREYRDRMNGRKRGERPQAAKPTFADVKYGPHERNVLDFFQAKSDKPTPLVVYIHGGGFVGGSKRMNPRLIQHYHDAGMSVASIHYRFINGKDVLLPEPQRDGARAVQFLRSKAQEWNIDPKRVACFGGSAGAGISMWIGFHDDLAKPDSDDPVERQSTRIQAIGTTGGQSTYDPIKIKDLIGGRAWEHGSLFVAYGLKDKEQALNPTPELQKRYDESSAIMHLTKDDPPLFMLYSEADGPLPADARPGQGIHHPNFGRDLVKKMNELNIENVFIYTPENKGRNTQREMLEFFQKQFDKVD